MLPPSSPPPLVSWPHAVVGFALFGIVTTSVPLLSQLSGVPLICGPFPDCNAILALPVARWAGVPVSAFGLGLFATALALASRLHESARSRAVLGILAAVGSVSSALLQWSVYQSLGRLCPWCVGAFAAAGLLTLASLRLMKRPAARQRVRPGLVWLGLTVAVVFVAVEYRLMVTAAAAASAGA